MQYIQNNLEKLLLITCYKKNNNSKFYTIVYYLSYKYKQPYLKTSMFKTLNRKTIF